MKKFIYLCVILLINMDLMAQFDPYDQNWKPVLIDEFNEPNRQFDSTFQEPQGKWIAFSHWLHPSGITKKEENPGNIKYFHHIYNWQNCTIVPTSPGVLQLRSEYIPTSPLFCTIPPSYKIPPRIFDKTYECDQNHPYLYFYSGMIESFPINPTPQTTSCWEVEEEEDIRTMYRGPFRYGYFEIRCKLPVHKGAFPAFWLSGGKSDPYFYESIDIFEYSWAFTNSVDYPNYVGVLGSPRYYLNKVHDGDEHFINIPKTEPDLSQWHTFACEWLPERVTFYRDGAVTAEERNVVPSHYLSLKANYAIDRYVFEDHISGGTLEWMGSGTMFIDYIKVYQLEWACETDTVINRQSDLDNFHYSVKKSINITSSLGNVAVGSADKVTFRVTDAFEITGPFLVNTGGELTVIAQECPDPTNREEQPQTPKNRTP